MRGPTPISLKLRLEKHKEIDPITGCWLWTASKTHNGYGQIMIKHGSKHTPMHVNRVAMYVYKDFDLDSPELICHIRECPNRHCFNPEHLYVGDHYTNIKDAIALGKRSRAWGQGMGNERKKV